MTSYWAWWCLKSLAFRLYTQPFVQAQIKENIKAPRHWPLWGEFTGDWWIPCTRASNAENVSTSWRHHGHPASLRYWLQHAGRSPWLPNLRFLFVFIFFHAILLYFPNKLPSQYLPSPVHSSRSFHSSPNSWLLLKNHKPNMRANQLTHELLQQVHTSPAVAVHRICQYQISCHIWWLFIKSGLDLENELMKKKTLCDWVKVFGLPTGAFDIMFDIIWSNTQAAFFYFKSPDFNELTHSIRR